MQKIKIENFGPINNCTIDVEDHLIFMGVQASGKSTITKAIFFFKSLRDDLNEYLFDAMQNNEFDKSLGGFAKLIRAKFLNYWGSTNHLNNIQLKYYFNDNKFITITNKRKKVKGYVEPEFSPKFRGEFMGIVNLAKKYSNDLISNASGNLDELFELTMNRKVFFKQIQELTNDLFCDDRNLLFIPAGRSILATLSEQLKQVDNMKLDYLMRKFIEKIDDFKKEFKIGFEQIVFQKKKLSKDELDEPTAKWAAKLIKKILKGEYLYDSYGQEKILIQDGKFIKLNYSSSGQQEIVWILHLIFLFVLEKRKVFLIVEEPEAHLHPEGQKEIVELLYLLANLNNNQLIITTHSPYVLSTINNLLYAYKLSDLSKNEAIKTKIAQIIPQNLHLDITRVKAYQTLDGEIRDIFDYDLNMISLEAIDSASRIINQQFDQLFALED